MGERKEGRQHHAVALASFPRSAEFFVFIEHMP